MAATILIVEDEHAVARGIQYALQQEGYEVAVARSGEEGLDIATRQAPDLVVLDVRLPGMDGFEVLRRLRAAGAKMPVLVLTARDDEVDKVDRARARRRRLPHQAVRPARADEPDQGAPAPVVRRPVRRRRRPGDPPRRPRSSTSSAAGCSAATRRISLTATEFEILRHLASRARAASTPGAELLELLRDYEALDQDEKTINVHVSHLRDKIEDDPAAPLFVLTVRGVGYAFAER